MPVLRLAIIGWITTLVVGTSALTAQNVHLDYFVNQPHQYSPDDPWCTGVAFRNHMGHGGLFYNCDHQEDKRFSPYIYWRTQRQDCHPKFPILSCINQQIGEVRRRVCWGRSAGFDGASSSVPGIQYLDTAEASEAPEVPPQSPNLKTLLNRSHQQSSKPASRNRMVDSDATFRMTRRAEGDTQVEIR